MSIHKKHIECVSPLLDRLKLEAANTNEEGINQESGQKDPLIDRMPPETLTDSLQVKFERRQEERQRKKEERRIREENYDPKQDPNATGDPYRTLFISRLSYEATESDLKREFDMYGPIEKLVIVKNKLTGKSRGYAFILFEREKDMKGKFHPSYSLLLASTFSSIICYFNPPYTSFSSPPSPLYIPELFLCMFYDTSRLKKKHFFVQLHSIYLHARISCSFGPHLPSSSP